MDDHKNYRLTIEVVDATRLVDVESDSYRQDLERAEGKKQIIAAVKFNPPLAASVENNNVVPLKSYRSPLYTVVGPQEIRGFKARVMLRISEDSRTRDYQRDDYSS